MSLCHLAQQLAFLDCLDPNHILRNFNDQKLNSSHRGKWVLFIRTTRLTRERTILGKSPEAVGRSHDCLKT